MTGERRTSTAGCARLRRSSSRSSWPYTIAGLILAGWNVLVAQGLLEGLRPDAQDALGAFVNLLVPIVAAIIAAMFVTPTGAPALPIGTS